MNDKLSTYRRKRRFDDTPEPSGDERRRAARGTRAGQASGLSFVIQEHHARRLHYDFRLELDGTLKSWAVPKGPSMDPSVKRLAVHVEDHPLAYGSFEGEIPEGNYGAGQVIVWDRGTWEPVGGAAQASRDYARGKLKFRLHGDKLRGGFTLVRSRMRGDGTDKEQWLLIKERDEEARDEREFDVVLDRPGSVMTGRTAPGDTPSKSARAAPRARASAAGAVDVAPAPPARRGASHARAATAATGTRAGRAGARRSAAAVAKTDTVSARNLESLRELLGRPDIDGARRAAMPQHLEPQLATLVDTPPPSGDWSYEIKFDGYRLLARVERSRGDSAQVRLYTRTGLDWTAKFSQQARALSALGFDSAWLDGEAVVLDSHGVPSFQALQNAFETGSTQHIVFFVFDVPYLNGYDLRDVPLVQRRALARAALEGADERVLRFSEDFEAGVDDLLKSACEMSLEGIIGKRRDSPYRSGRSSAWIKLKCRRRQEFVIGGWTEPSGSRTGFGALLLGVYDKQGNLEYCGRVGTGFNATTLRELRRALDARATRAMPFAHVPRERSRTPVHWVKPELVAECEFAEWTDEGIVRQASFVGLREDKPARQIVHETAQSGGEIVRQGPGQTSDAAPSRAGHGNRRAPAAAGDADQASGAGTHAGREAGNAKRRGKTARETGAGPAQGGVGTDDGADGRAGADVRHRPGTARVGGIRVTHPDRVIDPDTGVTKVELVHYYEAIAHWMLPHLKNRPVALVRAPGAIGEELFFQKHIGRLQMPQVTQHPGLDPGHPALMTIDSVDALVEAAQMGAVELHTWNASADQIERPDRMVFDLDPDPALGWDRMLDAAQLTRAVLDELGLASFCKTSGGKGLHVIVPLTRHAGWDEVKAFAQGVAEHMARTVPERFSAKMGPRNRVGKIFVDYLRNNRGSTTVAAFSARARPGMGVSVPVAWDEVGSLVAGNQWTIRTVGERVAALARDPWADYWKTRQRLSAAMRAKLGL